MKKCRVCEELKPLSEYSPSRKGHRSDCKSCHNQTSKRSVLKSKLNKELAIDPVQYKAEELAKQYSKNVLWVAQGLKACRMANVTEEYFVSRYLKREGNVSKIEEVENAFKALRGLF